MPLFSIFDQKFGRQFEQELVFEKLVSYGSFFLVGNNDNISAGSTAEIWPGGGLYTFITSSVKFEAVSTSANDTSAGTGARLLLVQGLDSSYLPYQEFISMNGTSAVSTTGSFFRLTKAIVVSAGSIEANDGIVRVRVANSGSVVGHITTGESITQQAVGTVPANTEYAFTDGFWTLRSPTVITARAVTIKLSAKPFSTGVWTVANRLGLQSNGSSNLFVVPRIVGVLGEKTDFKVTATDVTENTTAIATAIGFWSRTLT